MFWNSWLKDSVKYNKEIIYDPYRNKKYDDYSARLINVFKEMYRVLKDNRYLSLTFHNRDIRIWEIVISNLQKIGFKLENIVYQEQAVSSGTQGLNRKNTFKGDFVYHALSWRNNYSYIFLDDEDLDKNDAVVISLPFSDSGSIHPRTIEILKKCEELNIPVLIDCAYINLSGELSVDLSYKCIHSVCFSLSKAFFSINRLRVGLRLKRKFNDDPVDVFNSLSMINNYGAFMGNELIKNFSPDFNYLKYSKKQKEVCVKNDLIPSKCVIFGLGGEKYQDYNRGGAFNRVCLSEVLVELQ
jgi:hypothetical protein